MRLMVDWITAHIEPQADLVGYRPWEDLKGRFDTGMVLKIKPGGNGEQEWVSAARMEVVGSYDNGITVRSPDGFKLELSGNPVKFLQGHNLFGSDDAHGLYFAAGDQVRRIVGEFPSPGTWGSFKMKGPRFSRIDVTRSYRFPTQAQARAWLRAVAGTARSRHGAASLVKDGTVYLGKNSRRWTMKIYAKADEINARGPMHRLVSFGGNERRILEEWAQGVLRFEVTLRGLELTKWPDLTATALPAIWQHYYDSVTLNRNVQVAQEGLDMADKAKVDNAALGYLSRWKDGEDLRSRLSKQLFYKWRRRLLELCGVDIAAPPVVDVKPVEAVELDAAGWDPEPIIAKQYRPDPGLMLKYPSH